MHSTHRSTAVHLATLLAASLLVWPTPSTAGTDTERDATRGAQVVERSCQGKRATIKGNRRANTIVGTPGRDVIWAGPGKDVVIARGGRDIVCGGPGSDILEGGGGIDHLNGQRARDQCVGPRKEHRRHLHHSCEVHAIPVPDASGLPPAPKVANARRAARSDTVTSADRRTQSSLLDHAAFDMDNPLCAVSFGEHAVMNLGNAYWTGAYNPGWIAIRIHLTPWVGGGWGNSVAGDWTVYGAPADGQLYVAHMGANIPVGQLALAVHYEVRWGDSESWEPDSYWYTPDSYTRQGYGIQTTGPSCFGWRGYIGP